MVPPDPFNLERFVTAQEQNYDEALAELRAGRKRTHWSWYVFPQLAGLGVSAMSVRYAISGLPEATAFLAHPILGARLTECVAAMNLHKGISAADVLGVVDATKFHSCITLFAQVAEPESEFHHALSNHFSGMQDQVTVALLANLRTYLCDPNR
jgi:uncharacterized protein (DUF1810 family)